MENSENALQEVTLQLEAAQDPKVRNQELKSELVQIGTMGSNEYSAVLEQKDTELNRLEEIAESYK